MVMNTLTGDRRHFIAAGLASIEAVGAASGIAHTASPSASWEAVRAAYVEADKAMNDYDCDYLTPAADRYEAQCSQYPIPTNLDNSPERKAGYAAAFTLYEPVQERFNDLVRLRGVALDTMLAHPAPDHSAAIFKVETILADERWECVGFDEMMGHLLTDLHRLSAGQGGGRE